MNPFSAIASDLGRTVAKAKPLLLELDNADTSTRPSEKKWAKKEILGHLLDSASNNHQRFVRATLQGSLTFPGYDQARLVNLQRFSDVDWNFLVDFWAAYNRFLAHGFVVCNAEYRMADNTGQFSPEFAPAPAKSPETATTPRVRSFPTPHAHKRKLTGNST